MSDQKLLMKEEVHRVIGCSMELHNTIGHGFNEKIYENALVVEFRLQEIVFSQQPRYPIIYKSVNVGTYIPDLICFETLIVDAKILEKITDREIGQMINYLKITGFRVGLLINFKHAKLEWKRVVL